MTQRAGNSDFTLVYENIVWNFGSADKGGCLFRGVRWSGCVCGQARPPPARSKWRDRPHVAGWETGAETRMLLQKAT